MSRPYHIVLSEEDIKILEEWYDTAELDREEDNDCDYDLILRIREAKQKPYTNFDKIKDIMTVNDLMRMSDFEEIFKIRTNIPDDLSFEETEEWLENEVKQ